MSLLRCSRPRSAQVVPLLQRPTSIVLATLGLLASCLVAFGAHAQAPTSPKALGMGGSYTAVARGQEALLYNPATLGLKDNPRWSFTLVGVAVGGTARGPGFRDYGAFLLDGKDDAFLSQIPDEGASVDVDAHASALGVQIGGFAVRVSYHGIGHQEAPRDLFDLFINGYEPGRTDYTVAGTSVYSADYLDVAAGYGFRLGPVGIGATVHYLRGRRLASRTIVSDARIVPEAYAGGTTPSASEEHVEFDYRDLSSNGGRGYALDLGVAWQPSPRWTLSGSVTGVVHTMAWDGMRSYEGTGSAADLLDAEALYRDTDADMSPVAAGDAEADALLEAGRLPRTLRLGAAFQPVRRLQLALAYQNQFDGAEQGARWSNALSGGAELNVPVLPVKLRGGYAMAFGEGRALALGASVLGLHAGVAQMSYTEDAVAHDHWTATVGISFSGRRPWLGGARRK